LRVDFGFLIVHDVLVLCAKAEEIVWMEWSLVWIVMKVVDDVIGCAPLYPSALLSRALWHDFSLISLIYNIGGCHVH
jgi:hypothetical protein